MASFTFTANATSAGGSPVTYSAQSIGADNPAKVVYIGVMVRRTGGPISITSITCNTVAMTSLGGVEGSSPANGNCRVQWFKIAASALPDPHATTADFVITTDNTLARSSIDVGISADTVSAFSSSSATINTAPASPQTMTLDLDVPDSGFVLGIAAVTDLSATSATFAWTGLTENDDRMVGSTGISSASASAVSAATPRSVSVVATTTGSEIAGAAIAIAFAPSGTDALAAGSFTLAGQAIVDSVNTPLAAGSFALAGQDINVAESGLDSLSAGFFILTGIPLNVIEPARFDTNPRERYGEHGVAVVSWPALGHDDIGGQAGMAHYPKKSVQASGTFSTGALTMEGSNDGVNWATLHDLKGNAVTFTAAGIKQISENTRFIRPNANSVITQVAVTVVGHASVGFIWNRR